MLLIKKKVYLIDESLLYMSLLRGKVKNLQSVLVLFSFFFKENVYYKNQNCYY